MRLAIAGAAELGRLIAYHAEQDGGYTVAGFYDDFRKEESFNGRPVLGNTEKIVKDYHDGLFDSLMVGIGYNHMESRAALFDRLKGKVPFANVIHSSCYVDPSCTLGEGIFLLPGVVLDTGVVIEDNVLINTSGTIAHHSKVEAHSFLAPGVHVAGLVRIGRCSFVGIGSTIIDCVSIAPYGVIGAGSVVLRDTEEHSVYVGVPASRIKQRKA